MTEQDGTLAATLPQIDTIVHLMFENRSLDNVLGWLWEGEQPNNMVPPYPEGPQYDGLRQGKYSLPLKPHHWSPVTDYPVQKGVGDDGTTVPNLDPNEGYPNVLNQIFGNALNAVNTPPPDGTAAAMQGFLQDFDADDDTWDETMQITETYTINEIPVLYGLAKQYAVSDRWYASMPTETNPNRAFSLCGTSLGRLVNGGFMHDGVETFNTSTIWNVLATKNVSMGLYFHETWENDQCFTQYTFPYMNQVSPSLLEIAYVDDPQNGFYARAAAGSLPAYTYIEPKWGYGVSYKTCKQGNDYHPPTDVTPGEKLLYDVYTALKSNTQKWKSTLLIVTFDEHGGTYDHHSPEWGATSPNDPDTKKSSFDFHLYGVRIPTLLISPYVSPGTVFRAPFNKPPFDHTSILSTLMQWKGINPGKSGLWDRVSVAPTFGNVLGPNIVNPGIDLPAPDCTQVYAETAEVDAVLAGIPGSAKRYIALRSKTLDQMRALAADYRLHCGT